MSLNNLFKTITQKVRVYSAEQEGVYPIQWWDIVKALQLKRGLNPVAKDYPDIPGLMVSQCQMANQDKKRSAHFLELFERATSVYERLIFINRAIDYDMTNRDIYGKTIEYYQSLLVPGTGLEYSAELEVDIVRYQGVLAELDKYYTLVCSVPILYDMDAKKRVELDSWVLNNRRDFPGFINDKFLKAVNRENRQTQYMWDATKGIIKPVELFKHQKFISDFLSNETPYRGCLLYYGLGSGKTLSSINVAEGIDKQVVVFLPASLSNNYRRDLYKKGCTIYHKKNHWCFVDMLDYKTPANMTLLKGMGFPTDTPNLIDQLYIENGPNGRGGFWCVQKNGQKNNYQSFDMEAQKTIAQTVHLLRDYKYQFIHYNSSGDIIRYLMLSHLGKYSSDGGKTVSVYERLVEPKLIEIALGARKPYQGLPSKDKRTLRNTLFEYMFKLNKTDEQLKLITNPLDNKVIVIDEVHNFMSMLCNGSDKSVKLYELIMRAENLRIVALSGTPIINSPFELSVLFNMLRGYSKYYHLTLKNKTDTYQKLAVEKVLQANLYIDQYSFIDIDKVFRITRIPIGFRKKSPGSNEIVRDETACPTNEQLLEGIIGAIQTAGAGLYRVDYFRTEYLSIYPDIFKSKPLDGRFTIDAESIQSARDSFYIHYVDRANSIIINENEFLYRSMGLVSFYNEISVYGRDIFPEKIESDQPDYVEVSDYQLLAYEKARLIERDLEQMGGEKADADAMVFNIDSKTSNVFKVFSRQKLLFTFPPGIERPSLRYLRQDISAIPCDDQVAGCTTNKKVLEQLYNEECQKAIDQLTAENLTINDSPFGLQVLSPKYAQILENINQTPGLVFGYSQFRSVEGIEIFARVLINNGYERFNPDTPERYTADNPDVHYFQTGDRVRYEVDENVWRSFVVEEPLEDNMVRLEGLEDPVSSSQLYRCRFATWSGTESVEQRQNLIKAYTSPSNLFGQELLILLTTSSGSEGINLKYVRQVHIMEPYWNKVRVEQVIGRARRIESHVLLPPDQRNVRIFLYVSRFTPSQLNGTWGQNVDFNQGEVIIINDETRRQRIRQISENLKINDRSITSDETLLDITNRKYQIISQFLKLIKRGAVDCVYNREANVSSDPSLADIKCLQRVEGSNVYAYNIDEAPKVREVGFLEKEQRKAVYVLPYTSTRGSLLHLLYETNVSERLDELKEVVPVYNFYSYYGINPLTNGERGIKVLIGSISRDADTGRLKLVLNQRFVEQFSVYEQIEDIMEGAELDIPSYDNEIELFKFIQEIVNNQGYKELLESAEEQPPVQEEEKPKKRLVKLNIKK